LHHEVSFAGEAKQRVMADPFKVTVKVCVFLLPVDGVFTGIDIDDESPFVSAPKEGVGSSAGHIFEGFQTFTRCEDVILKARECGLAHPIVLGGAQAKTPQPAHPPRGGLQSS